MEPRFARPSDPPSARPFTEAARGRGGHQGRQAGRGEPIESHRGGPIECSKRGISGFIGDTVVAAPPTTRPNLNSTTLPPATPASDINAMSNGPADAVAAVGQVTYYAHPAGECASPWLPLGTVVRITNPANDASVSCVVNDREADTERAIDLSTATFAEIAPLGQGVIDAQLRW